jgi:hypothetical protein
MIAVAATLLLGSVACAPVPAAVLEVPGSYTADISRPNLDGRKVASVLLCLPSPAAVELSGPDVGRIVLDWQGTTHQMTTGNADPLITPVLASGCGALEFGPTRAGYGTLTRITITAERA